MAAPSYAYGTPLAAPQAAAAQYYPAAPDPYSQVSAYSYAGYSPFPAAYPSHYSAGYAPAYQQPYPYPYPAPYPQTPAASPIASPYPPYVPAAPAPAAQQIVLPSVPTAPGPSPSPAPAPKIDAPRASLSAPVPFTIKLPNMRFECHVINFALSLYLALDESATEKPPILGPSPQTWEVTFVDEHLLVVRSTYGRFLSYKSSFIFRSIDTSPILGDDERFMYYRRDDGVFSIQTNGGKFLTGEAPFSKVRCDSQMSTNSTWTIMPLTALGAPATAPPLALAAPASTPLTATTPAAPITVAVQPAAKPTPPSPATPVSATPPPATPASTPASAKAPEHSVAVPPSKSQDARETLEAISSSQLFIPVAKAQRLPVGPPQDRVSAADELITLVRTAQDEAEAARKAIQAKNTADFAARAVRLREVAVKFRKLKKAVKAVAPAVGCVPVDLLRSAAAGLALELVRISNVSGAGPNLEAAYRGTGTAAKSALQAAEILKTNGPEVLISDHWEQNTQVKAVDGSGNAVPVTPLVLAPTTTPAPPVPLRQRMERKLTPAEEKELRAHFDQQMVQKVQKHVRYVLARKRLLKLVKEAKGSKDKSLTAARQRKNVLFEIVSTEQSFAKALAALMDHYQPSLLAAKDRLMTPEDATALTHFFGTLEGIQRLSKTLLMELEKRAAKWPEVTAIGDVFHPYIPMMKIYSIYVNDYDDFLAMVSKLKLSSRIFADLLVSCKAKSGHTLDFESLIIMPVQRMPRYQLLIKEILKFTDQSHTDYTNLTTCLKAFADMNLSINTAKRERDNRMLKVRCAQGIKGLPFDLLQVPSRAYVREGNLGVRRGSDVRHFHVFVFNDLAIFARQVTRASTDFALMVSFADLQVAAADECSFKLSGKGVADGELVVVTGSQGERDAWMKDITSYVDLIKLKEKADRSINSAPALQILRAVYGDLTGAPKDVTSKLQQIIAAQGGELKMRAESRQGLFGVSQSIFGDANKLQIVYTIGEGNPLSRAYSDFEEVSLP